MTLNQRVRLIRGPITKLITKLTRWVNPVALVSGVIGGVALLALPFFSPGWLLFKANRLVEGTAYSAPALSLSWTLLLGALWLVVFLAGFFPFRGRPWVLAYAASAGLVVAVLFIGRGTAGLLAEAGSSARVSLEGGVWLTLLAYYVGIFAALNEAGGARFRGALMVAPGLAVVLVLILTGTLNGLGLAKELANGSGDFRAEVARHLALSGTSVLLAAIFGVPAAIWAARREEVARFVLPTASLLQTLPSLALFGIMLAPLARLGGSVTVGEALLVMLAGVIGVGLLLIGLRFLKDRVRPLETALRIATVLIALAPAALFVVIVAVVLNELVVALFRFSFDGVTLWAGLGAPLSTLGVRGIGSAPALIALTLYALLPIVRNTYTGVVEVPKAATEAGRGMGMSPGQILRRVELPLALPLIVEGLRASAVLTIGITTVAYLIGAGGLGTFIQRGIDQVVPDLILLGAIPIILLALLVDGLLRAVGLLLTPRGIR